MPGGRKGGRRGKGEEKKGGRRLLKGKGREAFKGQEGLEVGEERHVPGVS